MRPFLRWALCLAAAACAACTPETASLEGNSVAMAGNAGANGNGVGNPAGMVPEGAAMPGGSGATRGDLAAAGGGADAPATPSMSNGPVDDPAMTGTGAANAGASGMWGGGPNAAPAPDPGDDSDPNPGPGAGADGGPDGAGPGQTPGNDADDSAGTDTNTGIDTNTGMDSDGDDDPMGDGGGEQQTCPLPTSFQWTSGPPIAQPMNGWVSLKDFTHVLHEGKHIVYMTTHDDANWGSAMFTFDDWPDAASAPQQRTSFGVAPTLFYFSPKDTWVLAYQWGRFRFSYRTSSDPLDPNGWGPEQSLYNTGLSGSPTGPIDQTVICNDTRCYLYFAGDNGHIYKSSMPIEDFPGEFSPAQDSGIQGTTQNLFEGVQVYSIKGSDAYLMLVEAQGSGRYYRAWTADDLEGPWTLLTNDFATHGNVTFSSDWTRDISHGDLIRSSADETFPIDPCNLQMLFQGRDPSVNVSYGLLPYRPGLLTFSP